jgi:monofunctional biosynthetic peptidoglycan transglycosylase
LSDVPGPKTGNVSLNTKVTTNEKTTMRRVYYLLHSALLTIVLYGGYVTAEERLMLNRDDNPRSIYNFDNPDEIKQWVSVNDNVMGGLSEGTVSLSLDSHLHFSGTISLENNGGFASVRTFPRKFSLDGYEAVRIRVKGDGRNYQFRVQVDGKFDGIAFKHDFSTSAGEWLEIDLPFASFQPTFRGRIPSGVKPLSASEIKQMGFLIADKTAGPFSLIVDEVTAFR